MATPRKAKRKAPVVVQPPEPEYDDTLVGYARVSTEEQNLDMQIAALKRAGVDPRAIYAETRSGVSTRRPARDFAVKHCRAGYTFVTWKLDRVGRSLKDLLNFLEMLEERGVKFRSIQDNIDTSTAVGRLITAVIGAISEFERELTKERTQAGVKRAQERGVRFGREPKIGPKQEAEIEKLIAADEPLSMIAERYKVTVTTVRRHFTKDRLMEIRAKAAAATRRRK